MDGKNVTGPGATSPTVQNTDMNAVGSEEHVANGAEADMVSETAMKNEPPETSSSDTKACPFFIEGRCRFGERCRQLHPGPAIQTHASKSEKGKKSEESENTGKKPPMKTAEDVIARIQWDDQLPTESFTIGYLDRFLGIMEKPFSAFSWEDFASVGYDVLAIPKHRIQYFKYQDLVVWDKTTRTDDVFGSTGGGRTILDIIEKYQQQEPETRLRTETNEGLAGDLGALTRTGDDDDDDEGDEVEEDVGKQPRADGIPAHNFPQRQRPSHFVAIRIASEEIRSAVKEVQNELVKANPGLVEFCTPVPTLHLTLCLLHLDSPEEIQRALTALQELMCESQRLLPPALILHFQGLSDFHSRVLYLEPASTPELARFARALERGFTEKGLTVICPPSYDSLHVTIAKIPQRAARKDPALQLSRNQYGDSLENGYGSQQVDSLSFCYAGRTRRTDGFYTTLMEFALY